MKRDTYGQNWPQTLVKNNAMMENLKSHFISVRIIYMVYVRIMGSNLKLKALLLLLINQFIPKFLLTTHLISFISLIQLCSIDFNRQYVLFSFRFSRSFRHHKLGATHCLLFLLLSGCHHKCSGLQICHIHGFHDNV